MTIDEARETLEKLESYLFNSNKWVLHGYVRDRIYGTEGAVYFYRHTGVAVYLADRCASSVDDDAWVKCTAAARDTVLRENPEAIEIFQEDK